MPPADSTALIVARFLKSNHYNESYQAFIDEAGLPQSAGDVSKGDLTLETLLEEKKTFDVSLRFEKLGVSDGADLWTLPAPLQGRPLACLPSSSNLLSTTVHSIAEDGASDQPKSVLFATSADRRLHIVNVPGLTLQDSLSTLHDSPILSCEMYRERLLLSTSMSGLVIASDLSGEVFDKRRDHSKYVVKLATYLDNDSGDIIATAGWDNKVNIYKPTSTNETSFTFGNPFATITLPSKPESLLFLQHPEDSTPILLLSRTDSSFLYYYTLDSPPRLLGQQNLAPHSNTWIAFTPSSLALSPRDKSLLAVGTSSLPHMKLLLVRLLFPENNKDSPRSASSSQQPMQRRSLLDDTLVHETQASQARAALAIADREQAAIEIHATTMAPQTAYSTPAVAWRPDGSGVWVNGDDGAVRGIEASTGKVACTLRGHEEGFKVRCLWAGYVDGEEILVSGGFDQKLIVWKTS